MASQPFTYVTPEEYLKVDRKAQVRHDHRFGEIVAMAGGSKDHSAITVNTIIALANRLPGKPCRVYEANLRISLHRDTLYSYADAVVVCGKPEFLDEREDTLLNPKLVIEVLSPCTRDYDLGRKARMYLQIPSLTDLLLIEQEQIWIEYWRRQPRDEWSRKIFLAAGDCLRLESLDCELPVSEIYSGVDLCAGQKPGGRPEGLPHQARR